GLAARTSWLEIARPAAVRKAHCLFRFCSSRLSICCYILHRTSHIKHQSLPAKNGLCCFSSTTVVMGPCPGQIIVSSGNVRIFSRLFCNASLYDTLPPPIDPANSESPTIAIGRASPVTTYVIPPGECPHVSRLSISRLPRRNCFLSSMGSAPG